MEKQYHRLVPKGVIFPFILLTSLFFLWAIPNNLTDTMLATFKRIMSLNDRTTAIIQLVAYFLGYGCFAIPGALFIKKHTYKSGVMLGLLLIVVGALLFYPAMFTIYHGKFVCFALYLLALFILFAGLSVLETSTNSYVFAIGDQETATRRLNLSQSFNPFGALTGAIISQVFVLSQLNTMSEAQRNTLASQQLINVQLPELKAVTMTYVIFGLVILAILVTIYFTKMPNLKEDDKTIDFKGTGSRLYKNKRYIWSVVAQFLYVGAQVAVWSYTIRYVIHQLQINEIVAGLGSNPSVGQVIDRLRHIEPVAAGFYNFVESIGLNVFLPRTAEQAAATYYILSLMLFVSARFLCTWLMKYIKPVYLLILFSVLASIFTLIVIYSTGFGGIYALMGISFCMSLMFPTIYGIGVYGLGDDTKLGGSGMVMAIAGAAVMTQLQGLLSDHSGSIKFAYWVPAIGFLLIAIYSIVISRDKSILSTKNSGE